MLLNRDWPENRAYIEKKYDKRAFDPATGLDNAAIRAGLDKLFAENPHMSHALLKAQGFGYVLDNARVDINEHDWFAGLAEWNEKSMDRAFCARWFDEVKAQCAPGINEMNDLHNRAKTHMVYLDYCHSVPDWDSVLSLGFAGLRRRAAEARAEHESKGPLTQRQKDYFDAIDMEYAAIDRFLARLRDLAYAQGNDKCRKIGDCLESIRAGAPQTMYEAMQTIWLYFLISEYVDCLQVRSIGNLDVALEPYYRRDLEAGRLTRAGAADLLAAFLMQASAMRYYWGHPFYMGGTAADGSSLINDLSFLILDVYDELGIYDPKIQIKLDHNTPEKFVKRVLEMIRGGHSSFNFVCERGMTRAMLLEGYTPEEARRAVVKGCYEYTARGDGVDAANVHVNLPKAVELALHNGWDQYNGFQSGPHTGRAEDMSTFEQFYEAFFTQAQAIYERGFAIVAAYESRVG